MVTVGTAANAPLERLAMPKPTKRPVPSTCIATHGRFADR
jgi:hypothetical protein